MVLYLGDSLTRGLVGYSYIKYMKKCPHKNRGKDGDTVDGALRRLRRYRRRSWYGDVRVCVVEIGTNDLLQPFLMGKGAFWRGLFALHFGKKWADPGVFEAKLRDILDILRKDGKEAVLMGLPLMQLKGYPMEELRARNGIIRDLAGEYGLPFADVMAWELRAVPEAGADYDWGRMGLKRGVDILTMGLLPFTKEWFSRARGLELTVDGVHFNRASAALAARCVEEAMGA